MRLIYEGAKSSIEMEVRRERGTGPIILSNPQYRIVDAARALITGFDWAVADWDDETNIISAMFDSSVTGITAVGKYYMQFRATIGAERYEWEVTVQVREWGP